MKRKLIIHSSFIRKRLRVILLKMKLLSVLLFTGSMAFAASSYSQMTKIDLQLRNASMTEILNSIEKKSEFIFIYNKKIVDLKEKKTISVRNESIEAVLEQLFRDTGVMFRVDDRQVFLYKDDEIQLLPIEAVAEIEQPKRIGISGKVTDAKGDPIPGASVIVKGTTIGTVTGGDGVFVLEVPEESKTLSVSFVGYKTVEIPIGTKSVFSVVLEELTVGLEEVVAVGYGTMRKKDLTGSVSSVNGQTLKDIPVTSVAQAIAGRLAGVQVTKTEGSPDAEIQIRVRGGGSVTQDNSPLFLVDGFPVENINDIAPTDIQSIDVLKDASSTAIYGARGANGVVLITTKGGTEKKGTISYNTYYGIKNVSKILDVMDPYEFVLWTYESFPEKVTPQSKFGDFRDFDLYKEMKGTNWQDEVFGRMGSSMYHNLAFTGGTKTSKYNISLTQNNEKEVMIGSGYNRTNLTINYTQKVNEWLTIDLKPRLSDTNYKGAGTTGGQYRLSNIVQYRPVNGLVDIVDESIGDIDAYDPQSEYAYKPVDMLNDDYRRSNALVFNLNGAAIIKFSKSFEYNFSYGTQYLRRKNDRFYGLNLYETYRTGRPMATVSISDIKSYRMANTLTYSKRDTFLPDSKITVMFGQELTSSQIKTNNNEASYLPKEIDPISALAMMQLAEIQQMSTSIGNPVRISSFFGRFNFDYKGRYNLSTTVRADGSSKFAPGNQWGYFPSMGVGWNISEEEFLKSAEWLKFLKLRASYGEAGNNRITDNAWQKTFSVGTGSLYMGSDQTMKTPLLQASGILSNKGLKWETTVSRNLGFDFVLFQDRLSGSVDLYKNSTKDLLIRAILPGASGYSYQWQNIGETSNKGIEITLNGTLVKQKDFNLSASFNIGMNKGMIEKLGEAKSWMESSAVVSPGSGGIAFVDDYIVEEGGQVGQMYGYENEGMYSFDDFDYNAVDGSYTLKEGIPSDKTLINAQWFGPGTLKLKDQNGDGIVEEKDKVVIGNSNPKHTGGFVLTGRFKNLDISAYFNWVYGNDIYNANKIWYTSLNLYYKYRNLLNIMNSNNRFTTIDKETGALVTDPMLLAEMNKNATLWSPNYTNQRLNDWHIENGSFLRLNTLTIGYTFPKNLTSKVGIGQLRIYATGYNLWVLTSYSGYDPEVSTALNPLTPGMDWQAYPRNRMFNFGLNVEF
jgi:TonB-linked SusC/RagA family outer membrane protein